MNTYGTYGALGRGNTRARALEYRYLSEVVWRYQRASWRSASKLATSVAAFEEGVLSNISFVVLIIFIHRAHHILLSSHESTAGKIDERVSKRLPPGMVCFVWVLQ